MLKCDRLKELCRASKGFSEHFSASVKERLKIAVEELAEAVRILDLNYNAGQIDLLSLTQVKKNYFTARNDLLRVQVERLKQRINLHLALGGSF